MATRTNLQERFGELLEQHRRIVFKVANTYCWHPEDRADLAQEICAQLWRAFPSYDPARLFSTWMYRIALNVAISSVRSSRRRERHTVPFDADVHDIRHDTGGGAEADERIRALYRVINQLDDLNRALLLLYLDEHSYREIADILGISETNVATKLGRLKQRLRNDIGTAS
jgi:RNA polymerase sigma factor (sigma-70 family)